MIKTTRLFKPGKRYRGFLQTERGYIPITFNLYPLSNDKVRIKYPFPAKLLQKLKPGAVVFTLVEEDKYRIAEIRVVEIEKDGKSVIASLDFITEDKRKLPRIPVGDFLDITATVECEGEALEGKVSDISLTSLAVETGRKKEPSECEVVINYKNRKFHFVGRVIRSSENKVVLEIDENNTEFINLVSKVYSELFLKTQRGFES
ncbi:MAG: PilZ domain-containing protein [Aquificae bacterium]|nr:PilZ domain-containing protein [Aquificota bacterium]